MYRFPLFYRTLSPPVPSGAAAQKPLIDSSYQLCMVKVLLVTVAFEDGVFVRIGIGIGIMLIM